MMCCVPTVDWILECGCEPMVEHCAQCDNRRKVREYALKLQELHDIQRKAADLREAIERTKDPT